MLRFGTDGVRGVALTELTTAYVEALGSAAARVLGAGTWLVGRDTRESGPVLQDAFAQGLAAGGSTVIDCGDVPTPALAHASFVRRMPAAMVTASHNAYTDNGVKIFAAGGSKLSDDIERRIERELDAILGYDTILGSGGAVVAAGVPSTGSMEGSDVLDRYVDHIVGMFPTGVLSGLGVVLDCANGAMSVAAPIVLRALGADVTVINASPDGTNINASCGATHTGALAAAVVAAGVDAGLAFDGDGDRVIAIDGTGAVVDGDRLIALGALQLRSEGALTDNTVVVTVMSNLGFHHAMREAGVAVVTTSVGDRNVLEALDLGGYAIGGEQSGHVIYRHNATTGDGLLAGLKLLQRVRSSGRTLADLAGSVMTTYPQILVNIRVGERHPDIAAELADEIAVVTKLLGDDGRVLVRPSGTEPLVRVMVEAASDAQAAELAEGLAGIVRARYA